MKQDAWDASVIGSGMGGRARERICSERPIGPYAP